MIFSCVRRPLELRMPKSGNRPDKLGIRYFGPILNGRIALKVLNPRFSAPFDGQGLQDPLLEVVVQNEPNAVPGKTLY